jgi:hypothetical protein
MMYLPVSVFLVLLLMEEILHRFTCVSQVVPPCDGLVLSTPFENFIHPADGTPPYPPLDRAEHGLMHIFEGDELARSLLTCGAMDVGTERVVIRKLLWDIEPEQGTLGRYLIRGVDATVHVVTPDDRPDPKPQVVAAADAFAGLDFLSDMTKSIKEDSARSRRVSAALPHYLLDAMGEDRDELERNLEELFDDEAGDELYGLVMENNEQMRGEEMEQAEQEADIVEGAEQGEFLAGDIGIAAEAPRFTNMREHPPDSNSFVSVATGKDVGRIHFIKGNAKATCKAHRSCVCYVTTPRDGSVAEVVADLQKWLDNFVCSEAAHDEQARVLKRDKYGMRVRT